MAIKPQKRQGKEKLNVTIDPDVSSDLKAYAAYLDGSEIGYTVQELLRLAMAKDTKFQKYLATNKTTPAAAAKPEPVKKAVA
jgi:hypothetical protein